MLLLALQAPHATTPAAAAAAMQHITSLAGADAGAAVGSLLARALLLQTDPRLGHPPRPKQHAAAAATQEGTAQHQEQPEQQLEEERSAPTSSEQAQKEQQQQQQAQQEEGATPLPEACAGNEILLPPLTERNTRKVGPWASATTESCWRTRRCWGLLPLRSPSAVTQMRLRCLALGPQQLLPMLEGQSPMLPTQ